ncbi:MAG: sulfatase-like hydrolase/transferase [Planctomycetota bacterium]|jgi:arylsulfatase A-like enzyme|nr:sulfatase-like hydrolase/transferase [Planctomycetota bacterium]
MKQLDSRALSAVACLTAALAPLAPLAHAAEDSAAAPPNNVLVILVDQLSARTVGCYDNGFGGLETSLTPSLDALADEGVRFENAFVSAPQCSPSRFSILTGREPHRHGLRWNGVWEPRNQVTLPALARDAGYVTATIGKHHMMWLMQPRPLEDDLGFDRIVDHADYVSHCQSNGRPVHTAPGNWTPVEGLPEALDFTGYTHNENAFHPSGFYADQAIEFLEERGGPDGDGRPFLCFFSFYGPHAPLLPSGPADPHDWGHLYQPSEDLELPPNHEKLATTPRLANRQSFYASMSEADWRDVLASYYGLITQVDHNIGRVLDRLEELGLAENTLVLFTADHGEMSGEMGAWDKGAGMADALTRVPLIARLPGVLPEGRTIAQFSSNVDLMPTVCEMAALPVPDGLQDRLDGESLLDLMVDPSPPLDWRREVFSEFGHGDLPVVRRARMIRTATEKLVVDELGHVEEYYRMRLDPWEEHDRSGEGGAQRPMSVLRARLAQWWGQEPDHAPEFGPTGDHESEPMRAEDPAPRDGAVGVSRTVDPTWTPSTAASHQTVWLGTDPDDLQPFKDLGPVVGRFNAGTLEPATTYYWAVEGSNPNGATGSPLWSFTTEAGGGGGPGLCVDPSPADRAEGVDLDADLAWSPPGGFAEQNLWFGPPGGLELVAAGLSGDTSALSLPPLDAGGSFVWRIDTIDPGGVTVGDEWRFVTAADSLPSPGGLRFPPHLSREVQLAPGAGLSWEAGAGAVAQDVYFGTQPPLAYQGTQVDTLWVPPALTPGETYYWRVDQVGPSGTRRGWIWRFTCAE